MSHAMCCALAERVSPLYLRSVSNREDTVWVVKPCNHDSLYHVYVVIFIGRLFHVNILSCTIYSMRWYFHQRQHHEHSVIVTYNIPRMPVQVLYTYTKGNISRPTCKNTLNDTAQLLYKIFTWYLRLPALHTNE